MNYHVVRKALKEIKETYNLDFVYHSMGTCCNSCAIFETEAAQEAWDNANTYLVGKWFSSGMNHHRPFSDLKQLAFNWTFDIALMDDVCSIFRKHGFSIALKPESSAKSIVIEVA